MPRKLTRAYVAELERKWDAEEPMTPDELDDFHRAMRLSYPKGMAITVEEGEPAPAEADELEAQWGAWYERPIAASLFAPSRSRIHVPTRSDSRPRGRRRRSSRRARSPDRLDDDPPEPELASLRAISPEAFAIVLERAGL